MARKRSAVRSRLAPPICFLEYVHFNLDIFQGAISAHHGLVENKKFVLDDLDNELIDWFNKTVSKEMS